MPTQPFLPIVQNITQNASVFRAVKNERHPGADDIAIAHFQTLARQSYRARPHDLSAAGILRHGSDAMRRIASGARANASEICREQMRIPVDPKAGSGYTWFPRRER